MPILCATDFSPSAGAALALAAELGRKLDQPLLLFHAVELPYGGGFGAPETLLAWARVIEDAARARLEDVAGGLRSSGLAVTTELAVGRPATHLLALAAARRPEAIVIGTHGRQGVVRLLVGSVAEQVVREAHQPVFVVHAGAGVGAPQEEPRGPWKVAVLLDGTAADDEALAFAHALTQRTACELTIVRVLSPDVEAPRHQIHEPWEGEGASAVLQAAVRERLARQLAPFPALAAASQRLVVATEPTVARLSSELGHLAPDLVVVGRGQGRLHRPVRVVTLLRTLTVPVVCVPPALAA